MTDRPTYVYVTYIAATPERVWEALTDADLTASYWGHRNESDWRPGSRWEHVRPDGSGIADVVGTVLEARAPDRLVLTFPGSDQPPADPPAGVPFTIAGRPDGGGLPVTPADIPPAADREAAAAGWPAVLANLKSLLETGRVLPQPPWEFSAELREQQMSRTE